MGSTIGVPKGGYSRSLDYGSYKDLGIRVYSYLNPRCSSGFMGLWVRDGG